MKDYLRSAQGRLHLLTRRAISGIAPTIAITGARMCSAIVEAPKRARGYGKALILALLALQGSVSHAADVTWPARYGELSNVYWAGHLNMPPLISVETEAEVCLQKSVEVIMWPGVPAQLYCPQKVNETSFCSPYGTCTDQAGIEDPGEFGIWIAPMCGDYPRTSTAPNGSVPIKYDGSQRTGAAPNHVMCSCPEGSTPHPESGSCLLPRVIELKASRKKIKPGEAREPVQLTARVSIQYGDSYQGYRWPADKEFVELSVTPSTGVPGALTPASGVTNGDTFNATYQFPEYLEKGRIDTIRATCRGCAVPATVELKVAPIVVGFFNGVWNTDKQAGAGLQALEELIGPTYQGADLRYENFYNQTGAGNGNTALQDIAEVFIQRGKELDGALNNRWEHYWELLAGKHAEGDSLTARLLNGFGNGASALAGLVEATFNAMLGQMFSGYSQMLSNPPTAADVAAQLQKLRGLADEEASFVLIAHSQGNLFVNSAYDGLRSSHPDAKAGVVHVAPASPTLRGEHLLADIDLVINGLRVQGIGTVAPNNINLPASKSDLSGHTLVGTYLDAARPAREKINGQVQAVLGRL